MRLFHLGVLVSAFALAFVLPGAADAKSHIPVASGACPAWHFVPNVNYNCASEFSVRASNGYRLRVSGNPATNGPGGIEIRAESPSATVVYTTSGSFTSGGIKASLGRLGKLSLRFRPSGKVRRVKVPKSCLKRRPPVVTARLGTFVGTFDFHGERGYTSLSAHRIRGGIGDPLAIGNEKLECEGSGADGGPHPVVLAAFARHGGPQFTAAANRPPIGATASSSSGAVFIPANGGPFFIASLAETSGEILIVRFVSATGPARDFVFDKALSTATVTPPPPFTGTGVFERNADGSTSWSGSLSAAVPGLGLVQLTGPSFKGQLIDGGSTVRQAE